MDIYTLAKYTGIGLIVFWSLVFMAYAIWLIIDKNILRKRYYRMAILRKEGGIKLTWALRTEQKSADNKYNIAKWHKSSFLFTPEQVQSVAGYDGLVAYENNMHCLTIDSKKLDFDSKSTIHPNILQDLINTKLISEILGLNKEKIMLLLVISIICGIAALGASVYYGRQNQQGIEYAINLINQSIMRR